LKQLTKGERLKP